MSSILNYLKGAPTYYADKASIRLGRPGLYYGHCRWSLVIFASLMCLIFTRDLELLPIVGLTTYFLAHYPAKWLALYAKKPANDS